MIILVYKENLVILRTVWLKYLRKRDIIYRSLYLSTYLPVYISMYILLILYKSQNKCYLRNFLLLDLTKNYRKWCCSLKRMHTNTETKVFFYNIHKLKMMNPNSKVLKLLKQFKNDIYTIYYIIFPNEILRII